MEITRPELEAMFASSLNAGELSPVEQAAVTEALESADCDNGASPEARADAYRVARGLGKLGEDLIQVADTLMSKAGRTWEEEGPV